MKKFMMMAMMAAAATTAFAQDALVKEAKKLSGKGDFNGALQTLAPALTSSETLDKAAAWNMQSQINYDAYMAVQKADAENQVMKKQVPYDTLAMYKHAVAAWEGALKCDELDQLPDAKGKVKLNFRSGAQNRFKNHGVAMVQGGQYFYSNKKYEEALNAWKLYLGMKDTPIFAEVKDFPRDPFYADIAYYAAFLSYQQKHYADAEKYAQLTKEVDPSKAADANEIMLFAKKDNMKSHEDSLAYVAMVKEMHKADPADDRYFNLLMEYYTRGNNPAATQEWLKEEIATNPENKMVWALKGEAEMNSEKWAEAIESYKKAIEIDNSFVQCVFNAGRCYYAQAMELQNQLADKNNMITPQNREKVAVVVNQAKDFYLRARELDPSRDVCNWAYPLYQIYYWLKDEAKMKELESVDPSLAQ
ncbi:MAG: tetratricopeptide repeat protein [Prevotella sp.]|nr:tetratricopeptide repeat protein [Prevotella sp.]MBR0275399.1 tetratricopeptide repeat protein [Prevotella sp.]